MTEMPPLQNYTELAVAIGGLVKGQEYVTKTIDEIRDAVSGQAQVVATHAVLIAENRTIIDSHTKLLEDAKPAKNSSTAIIATVIAGKTLMLRLTPPDRVGEFYGLYGMVGRFSAVTGPLIWGATTFIVVEQMGKPAVIGEALAILMLLGMVIVAYRILHSVSDEKRDWVALGHLPGS